MDWFAFTQAVASVATSIGVGLAALQLRQSQVQERSQFEDGITEQYRAIIRDLPLEALFGEVVEEATLKAALPDFYRYIDLCNEQIFLRQQGRVSKETWANWCDGMRDLFRRPAFENAWLEIERRTQGVSFDEFRRLKADKFQSDPAKWGKEDAKEASAHPPQNHGDGQGNSPVVSQQVIEQEDKVARLRH